MTQPLSWDFLGRDHLSDVLERIAKASEHTSRAVDKLGNEATAAGRKMENAEPSTRKLHSGLDRLGDGAAKALSALKTFGVGATLAFGAAGVSAIGMGLKTAAANEQAGISFKVMLGSADKAKAFLASLQDFANKSPFKASELRDYAAGLLSVGARTNEVIPLMTTLAETAGMRGGSEAIGRVTVALEQMRLKGKVQAEEMMQMSEAGVDAWGALAAQLGITVPEAMKKVTAGSVAAQTMWDALEQHAGATLKKTQGMMAEQSTTLTGVWSTFTETMQNKLATFMEPALPGLKRLIAGSGEALDGVLSGIERFAAKVRGIFGGSDVGARMFEALGKAGREIIPVARDALDSLLATLERNKDGLEKFGNIIANDVIPALGFLTKGAIGNLVLGLESLITVAGFIGAHFQAMRTVVGSALKFVADYTLNYLGVVLHAANNAFGWIPGLGPKLRAAVAEFDKFAGQVRGKLNDLARPVFVPIYATYHGPSYAPIAAGSAGNIGARRLYATGGILGAASGMVLPDVVRVGENGPEELFVGSDGRSRIRPNNQTSVERTDVVEVPVSFRDPSGAEVQRALLRLARRRGYRSTAQLLPVGT